MVNIVISISQRYKKNVNLNSLKMLINLAFKQWQNLENSNTCKERFAFLKVYVKRRVNLILLIEFSSVG